MKKLLLSLLLAVPLLVGCQKKAAPVVVEGPLVPTARERKILRAYNLTAEMELGQKKLRNLRERTAKLEAAHERMDAWAQAKKTEEEEAAAFAD